MHYLQDISNQLDLIYIKRRDTETLKNHLEKAKATESNAFLCALCSLKKNKLCAFAFPRLVKDTVST